MRTNSMERAHPRRKVMRPGRYASVSAQLYGDGFFDVRDTAGIFPVGDELGAACTLGGETKPLDVSSAARGNRHRCTR